MLQYPAKVAYMVRSVIMLGQTQCSLQIFPISSHRFPAPLQASSEELARLTKPLRFVCPTERRMFVVRVGKFTNCQGLETPTQDFIQGLCRDACEDLIDLNHGKCDPRVQCRPPRSSLWRVCKTHRQARWTAMLSTASFATDGRTEHGQRRRLFCDRTSRSRQETADFLFTEGYIVDRQGACKKTSMHGTYAR